LIRGFDRTESGQTQTFARNDCRHGHQGAPGRPWQHAGVCMTGVGVDRRQQPSLKPWTGKLQATVLKLQAERLRGAVGAQGARPIARTIDRTDRKRRVAMSRMGTPRRDDAMRQRWRLIWVDIAIMRRYAGRI
jgi:hypothetical protein